MFSNQDLKKLIIPLVIEQLLVILVGFCDTIMVSSVGEAAVSAVSLVDSINVLLINIFSALATGGAVVAAQFIGQGSLEKARFSAKQLLLITAILSFGIMAVVLIFNTPILKIVFGNIDNEVMTSARTFFYVSALSYPFIALYNSGAALFRTIGNSKISMFTSAIMNVINMLFNIIFIFGLHLGVLGSGLATLLARIICCIVILRCLANKNNDLYISDYHNWTFNSGYIKKILTIGIPSGLENGMFQFGKILVQSLVATFGTYAIAANAVSNNLAQMQIIPGMAMSLAMVTVIGQCVGAGDYQQVKYYVKKLLKITYLMMAVVIVLTLLATPLILRLYALSDQTIALAYQCVVLHGFFGATIWPVSFTFPNALRAANDARYTMIVSASSMWIFRFCLSYVLGKYLGLGLIGVWIAMFVDWIVRSIFFIYRYLSNKWMNHQLV